MDGFKEDYKQLRDWSRILARSAKDKYEEEYPDVIDSMKTVKNNIITLENLLYEESERNTDDCHPPHETDADLDKEIASLSVSFDLAKQHLATVKSDLMDTFGQAQENIVEVNDKRTLSVRALLDQVEHIGKKTTTTQLEISQVALRYSTEEKKNLAIIILKNQMTAIKVSADSIKDKGFTYLSRVPTSLIPIQVLTSNVPPVQIQALPLTVPGQAQGGDRATPPTRSPLQRVPLLKFSGKTLDYLHFKTVFQQQATYDKEIDKVMALMENLTKQSDKNRICKELTLAACFEKLDGEYGDLTTLASECTAIIENLSPPRTDRDLVSFMDTVEDCLASLKGVQLGDTYIPTLVLSVEKKLDADTQKLLSTHITKKKPPLNEKPQLILDFLNVEKGAAKLRMKNYNNTSSQENVSCPISSSAEDEMDWESSP